MRSLHDAFVFTLQVMNIGFDAKRAFTNGTGLGHYSRTLVRSLAEYYPSHHCWLFTPKVTDRFKTDDLANVRTILPEWFPATVLKGAWRSSWVRRDLLRNNIDLYHGLSHEIPVGIHRTKVRSVVTIHDLIFERYPGQFNPVDVRIYRYKFRYACTHADRVIAISAQTKSDIIELYGIDEKKIDICYQSCNGAFAEKLNEYRLREIRKQYNLPDRFLLYVGSLIERKNLLNIVKALHVLQHRIDLPLVVIGDGGAYKKVVQQFIADKGMSQQVRFLADDETVRNLPGYRSAADFPAIYQMASCMIYPSIYEGFGIPVLEALWSGLPVITSNVSCLPETGGDAAFYVDPFNVEEMANGIAAVSADESLRARMIEKGYRHARLFTREQCAAGVMQVYQQLT